MTRVGQTIVLCHLPSLSVKELQTIAFCGLPWQGEAWRQGRKTRLLFALYSQFVRRWRVFHKISRAAGPEQQTTKIDRLSHALSGRCRAPFPFQVPRQANQCAAGGPERSQVSDAKLENVLLRVDQPRPHHHQARAQR